MVRSEPRVEDAKQPERRGAEAVRLLPKASAAEEGAFGEVLPAYEPPARLGELDEEPRIEEARRAAGSAQPLRISVHPGERRVQPESAETPFFITVSSAPKTLTSHQQSGTLPHWNNRPDVPRPTKIFFTCIT